MKWDEIKKRATNKAFLAALIAGIYQALEKYGYAPDFGTWQLWVDLGSYALIGTGIYSTFAPKEEK